MKHVLDSIGIGILEFNRNLECIYMNKYMSEYGVNMNNIVKNLKLYHKDDIDSILNVNLDLNSETICRMISKESIINNADLSVYRWCRIKRIIGDSSYTYIYEDIDEIKNLEIELRQLKVKSDNAYTHKSMFLANMSHEIRTPLNGIIGMLTLLEDTVLNNDQKNYIEMLRECSINLMTIINDILDYSKLEAGKIVLDVKCFDIKLCIESTNDILISKLYEKKLEYNYTINSEIPNMIKGDSNRIKQILLNLLTNSIKFTEKGNILLNVSPIIENNEFLIKFSITDTGCGIEEYEKQKLFKSFSQIETQVINKIYQGTGLGLAISKELVTLMGGKIWIDWSNPNEGSRFCFTIKADKCNDDLVNITMDNDAFILKNKTAMILDDKLENRLGLSAILQRWGMKVTTYNSGKEALYFLKNNHYDISFIDICMPDIDGIDFAKRLKQQLIISNRELMPLVALSSLGEMLYDNDELFKSHFIKPVKESKLKKNCIDILTLSKYKFTNKEDQTKVNLHNYLNNNNLNNSIKETVRILLVEDVPINQRVVISFLNKMGIKKIDVCENGRECLEMMSNKKYDILLVDIRMPILSGEYVLKYILNYYKGKDNIRNTAQYKLLNTRKPYVIAVTAYCLKEDREKYLQMGFDNYIPKPISINELNTCINSCIEKLLEN
jgi:signal transduction histidine kinase/DNA-binding response OmpR family regulator